MKALTEAGSLGGSKLNLKGTGWKTDGTSRSMDDDEVASGADCTVISGTRLTPSKSSARVLASSVHLGLARCGETTLAVVSGARSTRMLLFLHGGNTSSCPPPPGELTVVVVAVALRGKECHVVVAVEGHELEAPEAEQRPGLKRLLETTHLELNGKLFVNTQQAPT
jgi:hypothetical protein